MALDNVKEFLGGKAKEATGNVAKAYLCVRNPAGLSGNDSLETSIEKDSKAVQEAILTAAARKISSDMGDNPEALLKRGGKGDSTLANGLTLQELVAATGQKYLPMEVQYNPNSIRMNSDPGGTRRITANSGVGAAGEGQSIKSLPKSTDLQCTLIFERINVNDAFIQASEGWNASIGNITSTVGDAYKKLSGGANAEAYSVRKEVEGFLSMLNTPYTRDVIFYYGKMCFHGEMVNAAATYKMFNKNGDPIFAEVAIKIRQNSNNVYDNKRWVTAYEALFQEGQNDVAAAANQSGWESFKSGAGNVKNSVMNAFSGGIF